MRTTTTLAASAAALLFASSSAFAAHHEGPGHKAVAEGWMEASCGDLAGFVEYVNLHMAADGMFMPARYVGLGFTMMSDNDDDFATVSRVTAGSPASEVLMVGDQFVSVAGTSASYENRDNMSFRGKPGEPVSAVIMRGGKEMEVEITRGVIEVSNGKDTVLANLALADAESWPSDSCTINEVVAEGDVVYMTGEYTATEDDTGLPYTERQVTRFKFNGNGKIAEAWILGESRFVLEQLGYTISR